MWQPAEAMEYPGKGEQQRIPGHWRALGVRA